MEQKIDAMVADMNSTLTQTQGIPAFEVVTWQQRPAVQTWQYGFWAKFLARAHAAGLRRPSVETMLNRIYDTANLLIRNDGEPAEHIYVDNLQPEFEQGFNNYWNIGLLYAAQRVPLGHPGAERIRTLYGPRVLPSFNTGPVANTYWDAQRSRWRIQ
jgi:hypothetical protein